MILSDRDIKRYLQEGKIKIEPPPDLKKQLGSCSIDLRLGNTFRVFENSKYPYIDLGKDISMTEIMKKVVVRDGEPFIMQPGEFVLATTIESLEIADDLLARIDGRSSLGRLGIIVHGTSSVFDPGWKGHPTLELSNIGRMPVALYPGMRICAFTFEQLTTPAEVPYYQKPGHKYGGRKEPEPSKLSDELK
ncbi:MAG: dCTP deaminase [bacterium]